MLLHACLLGIDLLRFLNTAFKIQTQGLTFASWPAEIQTHEKGGNTEETVGFWAQPTGPAESLGEALFPFPLWCEFYRRYALSLGCGH